MSARLRSRAPPLQEGGARPCAASNMNDSQQLREQLAQRNRQLQEIAAQLKTELFGIDTIIDRVID